MRKPTVLSLGVQALVCSMGLGAGGCSNAQPVETIETSQERARPAERPVYTGPRGEPVVDGFGRSPLVQPGEDLTTALPFPDHFGEEAPEGLVAWFEAYRYRNREITVRAEVVQTGRASAGWPQFLDFSEDPEAFHVVVFASGATDLPEGVDPADYYLGKTIEVTHLVSSYRDRPQFQIERPGMIRVIGQDDTPPPPTDMSEQPEEIDGLPVVSWEQAHEYVGQEVYVVGHIAGTYYDRPEPGEDEDSGAIFLNFHREWQGKFYLVVFPSSYENFPNGRPDEVYHDRTLRVRGEVKEFRERPHIEIESPDQVEVLE